MGRPHSNLSLPSREPPLSGPHPFQTLTGQPSHQELCDMRLPVISSASPQLAHKMARAGATSQPQSHSQTPLQQNFPDPPSSQQVLPGYQQPSPKVGFQNQRNVFKNGFSKINPQQCKSISFQVLGQGDDPEVSFLGLRFFESVPICSRLVHRLPFQPSEGRKARSPPAGTSIPRVPVVLQDISFCCLSAGTRGIAER